MKSNAHKLIYITEIKVKEVAGCTTTCESIQAFKDKHRNVYTKEELVDLLDNHGYTAYSPVRKLETVGGRYVRTEGNSTVEDNLMTLPRF